MNPFTAATPEARIGFVMSILAQMPDSEILTLIERAAHKFSCFGGADDILSGVEQVREELAEEAAREWDGYHESNARAYRAMTMGSRS